MFHSYNMSFWLVRSLQQLILCSGLYFSQSNCVLVVVFHRLRSAYWVPVFSHTFFRSSYFSIQEEKREHCWRTNHTKKRLKRPTHKNTTAFTSESGTVLEFYCRKLFWASICAVTVIGFSARVVVCPRSLLGKSGHFLPAVQAI